MSKFAALDVGRVVAAHGRHVVVETPDGERLACHLRGKKSDCVVGDLVRWQPAGDEGVIEHVEPRRNLLFRQDDWRTKSFAANLDQILVLVAGEPMFSESQLARALIAADSAGIAAQVAAQQERPAAGGRGPRAAAALPCAWACSVHRGGAQGATPTRRARCSRRCWPSVRRWCWAPAAPARAR